MSDYIPKELTKEICPCCKRVDGSWVYYNPETGLLECEHCGAKEIEKGIWTKTCKLCQKLVDELYGLFVPHLCKKCYIETRNTQIANGYVCGACRKPYIDCCC